MDLSGAMGGDLFGIGGVGVQASANNAAASTATVAVTRTGAGALTSSDYILSYEGTAWSLRRADTGAAVPMTGDGSVATPFAAEGLSIQVGGTPVDGDSFLVRPTANAIDGLSVLISDPAKIAAAAPIRTRADTTNLGSGTISAGEVLNGADAALDDPVVIEFIDATHYSINGAGSFNYTSGDPIQLNGWSAKITGAPLAGDKFNVEANTGGVGDNRNALELASVLGKGVLSGGTESLNAASSRFVGRIGVAANQANVSRDSQQIIYDDTVAANDEVSGVNLDEEAANMVRYQQAYQAAAQVIRVTQEIFDSLINATRR
jgi:flagellar hook-associated protein 1 FlgK